MLAAPSHETRQSQAKGRTPPLVGVPTHRDPKICRLALAVSLHQGEKGLTKDIRLPGLQHQLGLLQWCRYGAEALLQNLLRHLKQIRLHRTPKVGLLGTRSYPVTLKPEALTLLNGDPTKVAERERSYIHTSRESPG